MTKHYVEIAVVDVFSAEPSQGNPAAVCILSELAEDRWMSSVAREMACTNTAFLLSRPEGYDLRWYTAGGVEVALCGHATLANAYRLYELGEVAADSTVSFRTKSGTLIACRRADGSVEMDLPLEPPAQVVDVPREISTGLGVKPVWVGRNRLDYVIEVESEAQLKSLRPAQDVLASLETRGFVVTAWADDQAASGYDYVLRFFGPRVGVPEDFVTGTAHCALAPYWRDRSRGQQQSRFRAFQASARSGYVDVELRGERVFIAAQAITVLRGVLLV